MYSIEYCSQNKAILFLEDSMNTGPLSQGIANLQAQLARIKSLNGLPSDIQDIQSEIVSQLNQIISVIQNIQSTSLDFAGNAKSQLNSALTAVNNNDLSNALGILQKTQNQADNVKATINRDADQIQSTFSQFNGYTQTLGSQITSLNAQLSSLQSQLASKRSEAASAKNKELYLIALGPFGLVGLAAAMALYEEMEKSVHKLERSAYDVANKLATVRAAQQSVETLQSNFRSVIGNVSNLKNAGEFVSNDIAKNIGDVEAAEKSENVIIAKLFIQTSLSEVSTLSADAA
ncbi:MAG: hypothetical protein KZQ59_17800 [Candidatus Thiodiazotropha sp. (ex Lucinoma aequizonata)]|nr:hypothetical protein [Candidatus Thiodiazotropha sp. (ex Lucinoma aequizonata)]